jgi:hypothetical protein
VQETANDDHDAHSDAAPAQITDSIFKQLTRQGFSISPRDAPELCTNIALENKRAQGKPGARCTRSLACEVKSTRA